MKTRSGASYHYFRGDPAMPVCKNTPIALLGPDWSRRPYRVNNSKLSRLCRTCIGCQAPLPDPFIPTGHPVSVEQRRVLLLRNPRLRNMLDLYPNYLELNKSERVKLYAKFAVEELGLESWRDRL